MTRLALAPAFARALAPVPAPALALALTLATLAAPRAACAQHDAGTPLPARLDSLQHVVWAEEARVQAEPRNELAWTRLARAWFQIGNHARGAQAIEQAKVLGAREFDTMLIAGRAARSEMNLGEAQRWLERATRIQPDSWEAHEDLGLTYYLMGRYAWAADQWRRAAALPGTQSPPRTGLLEALEHAGDVAYVTTGPMRSRVPFEYPPVNTTRHALPAVRVRVNGHEPMLFQIDLGSSEVVLGRALAQELGVTAIPGGESGRFVGGRAAHFDYANLDSLRFGSYSVVKVPCAISDHPALAEPGGVRGTLGLEVLRRFRFFLDYPDSTLALELRVDGAADTSRPAWLQPGEVVHRIPIVVRGTHLIVAPGKLGAAQERPILLDAGGPGLGFAASPSALAEAQIAADTTRAKFGTAAGGPVRYFELPPSRVCVGDACVDALPGVYGIFPESLELNPNFRIAALVSNGFLARYRYGVDLPRRTVWLVEPAGRR